MQLSMKFAASVLVSLLTTTPLFASALPQKNIEARNGGYSGKEIPERDHHHGHAQIHHVQVGGANIFAYTPAFVFAQPGDIIRFEFLQANHTLTQSSFLKPCEALSDGIDSGFMPNFEGIKGLAVFDLEIPEDAVFPQWFYCRQGTHCSKDGMVFAINPNVEKDFTEFFARAKGLIQ